jgi:hypothetical protein
MHEYNTSVEPERIARLPHYKGLPISFTTLVDENGIPNFKLTDNENVWISKRDGLCSICGEKLDYWKAFMVSEEEAETRLVFENPNHEECLRHAFNICPWLFYSKAQYSALDKVKVEGMTVLESHPDRAKSSNRPQRLGIYICNNYENVIRGRYRICKVSKAKRLEWIEGN